MASLYHNGETGSHSAQLLYSLEFNAVIWGCIVVFKKSLSHSVDNARIFYTVLHRKNGWKIYVQVENSLEGSSSLELLKTFGHRKISYIFFGFGVVKSSFNLLCDWFKNFALLEFQLLTERCDGRSHARALRRAVCFPFDSSRVDSRVCFNVSSVATMFSVIKHFGILFWLL